MRSIRRAYAEERLPVRRGAYAALLIQLRNGCLLSEALDALRQHLETGRREVRVRVRMASAPRERLIIIPESVSRSHGLALPSPRYVQKVARELGVTTSSLRYSFLKFLAERGVPPSTISRITCHRARLRPASDAEELLREVGW